jgi:signal transduction histidine kinase/ActR/RegA family two-component response regulator
LIPVKIEERFIQLNTDLSGKILEIVAGSFVEKEFAINDSIYNTCPFLEATLDVVPINDTVHIDNMFIVSQGREFYVDVEVFKGEHSISIIIINRTNVYQYVKQLNQNRNDLSIVKHKIDRQNKELEKLRKIADRASEEKSRFLAVMSHEIRNPLNSILGYAGMIASETKNTLVKDYVESLLMAGKNLNVIVGDILDLSRIEAGKLKLASEPISIKKIIENRVKNYKLRYKDSKIQINYLLSDQLPEKVLGDSVRITQVLSNLISNSFKFTEQGSITINSELLADKKNSVMINFSVSDTGRGMTPDQLKKIFKEYEQTALSDSRVHGGAGLGLSIVKNLVELMNGKVSVESKLNVGTTFILQIPFQKLSSSIIVTEKKPKEDKEKYDLNGIKVLLADDDKMNQAIASHLLKKEGSDITVVNDGLEALSQLKKKAFDTVLLDINMPNMSGEKLMKDKQLFKKYNSKTPIVALTANTSKDDVKRYFDLGFSWVISKPYTAEDLVSALGSVLKK